MKIIKNAIRCNRCGQEIESKDSYDYVTCKCGTCSVDGGHAYLRRSAPTEEAYTEISIIEDEKKSENTK